MRKPSCEQPPACRLLWDDGRLTRVRAGEGVTALAGRRVALHLQAQPDVAARLFADQIWLTKDCCRASS